MSDAICGTIATTMESWLSPEVKIEDKKNKLVPCIQTVPKAKKAQEALHTKIRTINEDDKLLDKFHETTKGIVLAVPYYIIRFKTLFFSEDPT
jgi:hypothetical protein